MGDGLQFPDLLHACDAAVSKLGYGVVSEAVANRVRLLWPPRKEFREEEIMGPAVSHYIPAEPIPAADFAAGRWGEPLQRLLTRPFTIPVPSVDGADVCARHVLAMINGT
jgi:L-arabinokinase